MASMIHDIYRAMRTWQDDSSTEDAPRSLKHSRYLLLHHNLLAYQTMLVKLIGAFCILDYVFLCSFQRDLLMSGSNVRLGIY